MVHAVGGKNVPSAKQYNRDFRARGMIAAGPTNPLQASFCHAQNFAVARLLVSALERVEGEPNSTKVGAALRDVPAIELGPMRVAGRGIGAVNRYVDITAISSKGGLVE